MPPLPSFSVALESFGMQACSDVTIQNSPRSADPTLTNRRMLSAGRVLYNSPRTDVVEELSWSAGHKAGPLGEIDEMIGVWWSCKYLPPSFDLHFDTNANTTLYLALIRSDG